VPSKKYRRLVWSDEFDGTSLDTRKWCIRRLGPRKGGINVRKAVSLDGKGHLVIGVEKVRDAYHTAMVGTERRCETRYGYFECRVKLLRKAIGSWCAFWLMPRHWPDSYDGNPDTGVEIDVFEYGPRHPARIKQNLIRYRSHWHRDPRLADGRFHTFGVERSPEGYVFFVDGRETWRTALAVSHARQYMILSVEVGTMNPVGGDRIEPDTFPDRMIVDYVRVYAH
jgi:beta-glucanase (GH16 family)